MEGYRAYDRGEGFVDSRYGVRLGTYLVESFTTMAEAEAFAADLNRG